MGRLTRYIRNRFFFGTTRDWLVKENQSLHKRLSEQLNAIYTLVEKPGSIEAMVITAWYQHAKNMEMGLWFGKPTKTDEHGKTKL